MSCFWENQFLEDYFLSSAIIEIKYIFVRKILKSITFSNKGNKYKYLLPLFQILTISNSNQQHMKNHVS